MLFKAKASLFLAPQRFEFKHQARNRVRFGSLNRMQNRTHTYLQGEDLTKQLRRQAVVSKELYNYLFTGSPISNISA